MGADADLHGAMDYCIIILKENCGFNDMYKYFVKDSGRPFL